MGEDDVQPPPPAQASRCLVCLRCLVMAMACRPRESVRWWTESPDSPHGGQQKAMVIRDVCPSLLFPGGVGQPASGQSSLFGRNIEELS
jgi:hypothetical protein